MSVCAQRQEEAGGAHPRGAAQWAPGRGGEANDLQRWAGARGRGVMIYGMASPRCAHRESGSQDDGWDGAPAAAEAAARYLAAGLSTAWPFLLR